MRLRTQAVAKYCLLFSLSFSIFNLLSSSIAAQHADGKAHPWMNSSLSPDERAALVVKEMTLDEKISMLHGTGMAGLESNEPSSNQFRWGRGICTRDSAAWNSGYPNV